MKCALAFLGALLLAACTRSEHPAGRKVLNSSLDAEVKGFDPAQNNDGYAHVAITQIYQPLLQYEYLTRPITLSPLLARALPEVSKDGLTYTFKLRSNVFFQDDPAFEGRARALKASDVVYSFERIADPKEKSPNWWIFEGRVEGLNEFRAKIQSLPRPINYANYPVSGLQAPDDETVVIRLTKPNRQFLYGLAMVQTAVVAREVVEKYGAEFLNHPVGTGPFVLKEWGHGQLLRFVKNPKYWGETYPTEGTAEDRKAGLLTAAGKPLPFIDELVLWIYVESQPRWLNFLRGNLDVSTIPKEGYDAVFDEKGELRPDILSRRIVVTKESDPDLVSLGFNMEDPIVGKNKYLRQAISAAFSRTDKMKTFYNDRAVEAHGIVPPGLFGYDSSVKNPYTYDLGKAKALMAKALELYHQQGGKGSFPPLVYDITNSTASRQLGEAMTRDMTNIGLRMEIRVSTWPQLQEKLAKKRSQFFGFSWVADYPDAENLLFLLYGPNAAPGSNSTNFRNAEYDRLFDQVRNMPDTPERKEMIGRMVRIAQEEVPLIYFNHRIAAPTRHAWVRNFKRNGLALGPFKYLDIDLEDKAKTLPLLK